MAEDVLDQALYRNRAAEAGDRQLSRAEVNTALGRATRVPAGNGD